MDGMQDEAAKDHREQGCRMISRTLCPGGLEQGDKPVLVPRKPFRYTVSDLGLTHALGQHDDPSLDLCVVSARPQAQAAGCVGFELPQGWGIAGKARLAPAIGL